MRGQEWRLSVSLLQEPGRTPLQHRERMLLKNPVRAPAREPLRSQERPLFRHEDRVRVKTQVQ